MDIPATLMEEAGKTVNSAPRRTLRITIDGPAPLFPRVPTLAECMAAFHALKRLLPAPRSSLRRRGHHVPPPQTRTSGSQPFRAAQCGRRSAATLVFFGVVPIGAVSTFMLLQIFGVIPR
jgi:hypothetical protein